MNRLDRALGILLLLRGGTAFSATEIARRFEVSTRTIYRDVEMLCSLGVPIYAEMGRSGGFRLVEGYFLPPVMFTVGEAISLLLGLALLRRLRARPFAAELDTSERKLLAAVPDHLRAVLAQTQQIVGFEQLPVDIFHPERDEPQSPVGLDGQSVGPGEGAVISVFVQAIFERRAVNLGYRSPYGPGTLQLMLWPCGLLWDRDRWYLVGRQPERGDKPRLWRADRVLAIQPAAPMPSDAPPFDIGALLGRAWLGPAIERWSQTAPVVVQMAGRQAERLKQDWYYRHARFEDLPGGRVSMSFGESDRSAVLDLLRWLGPGAELVEPAEWRAAICAELAEMLAAYSSGSR